MAKQIAQNHWLVVRFPFFTESADAVSFYLFERGAQGCEEKDSAYFAYFADQDSKALLETLSIDRQRIIDSGLEVPNEPLSFERIAEQDWHDGWRRFFKPVHIAGKLIVRPPWEKISSSAGGEIELILEPKQAFGTGTHATTKLMLERIVARSTNLPDRALDVGTGSGILAIAHALFHSQAHIIGCDIDAIAIENAYENAAINGVAAQTEFFIGGIESLGKSQPFPIIYANLQRHIIIPILPQLKTCLANDGLLLLSGILVDEEDAMRAAIETEGMHVSNVHFLEEWIALEVLRNV